MHNISITLDILLVIGLICLIKGMCLRQDSDRFSRVLARMGDCRVSYQECLEALVDLGNITKWRSWGFVLTTIGLFLGFLWLGHSL